MSTHTVDGDDESTTTTNDADSDTDPVIEDVPDAGFEAVIEADVLDAFVEPATAVVDEAKIHLDDDGLALTAVDPANVGMVDSALNHRAFEHYAATGGVIGVTLGRLEDIIGFAESGDDLVHLALDPETRKLHVEISGFTYRMALIDPDSIRDEPEIPELENDGQVIVEAKRLSRGVTAADMVADHLALGIDTDADEFYLDADGNQDDVHLGVAREDVETLDAVDVESLFSLDYLKDMESVIPSDAMTRLELGDELPVKLHFSRASSSVEVTFMLAPRIQS